MLCCLFADDDNNALSFLFHPSSHSVSFLFMHQRLALHFLSVAIYYCWLNSLTLAMTHNQSQRVMVVELGSAQCRVFGCEVEVVVFATSTRSVESCSES